MIEQLMQYVWQHRLWRQSEMRTVDGQVVQVLDPGLLNRNAGPDFFNAKVKIGGRLWVGNVEIHVKASDWKRHHHTTDPAYDSVILHVVHANDTAIQRSSGDTIPQMVMPWAPGLDPASVLQQCHDTETLPCRDTLRGMSHLHIQDWFTALAYERLYDKATRIDDYLRRLNGDWEEAAYVTLARAMGFGVNGEPFERLALAMPLALLGKHRDDLTMLEAMLLGQASLIHDGVAVSDPYAIRLSSEYSFLAHKFSLTPPTSLAWKMSRMRPGNFPHRRIATLAALIHHHGRLLRPILELRSLDHARTFFTLPLSSYWENHYTYGPHTYNNMSTMSHGSVVGMMINAVIPLMFAYGAAHDDDEMMRQAVELLMALPAETNFITRLFTEAGLKIATAFASQALVQLRRCYCERNKCLYCRIGHRMLTERVRPC